MSVSNLGVKGGIKAKREAWRLMMIILLIGRELRNIAQKYTINESRITERDFKVLLVTVNNVVSIISTEER